MDVDLDFIMKWAYTTELDQEVEDFLDSGVEEVTESFDRMIFSCCDRRLTVKLATDQRCLKKEYFAQALIEDVCGLYSMVADVDLPFKLVRQDGLIPRDVYIQRMADRAAACYDFCVFIDELSRNNHPAVRDLYKMILDARHETHYQYNFDFHHKILSDALEKILPKFSICYDGYRNLNNGFYKLDSDFNLKF